jgi:Tfp pilus assembly protein PilF
MGLFSWLFGKRSQTPQGAGPLGLIPPGARPQPVPPEAGDDSLWVMIDTGGMATVLYRDTYEHMSRPPDTPDPRQGDLDGLLPTVSRVRVFSGGLDRGRVVGSEVLAETADPAALAELRAALRLVPNPPQFGRCACLGGPTLELWAGDAVAALLGLQHGNAVRWRAWRNDGPLDDGARLTRWLTDRGVDPGLIDRIYHNQYQPPELPPGSESLPPAERHVRMAEVLRQRGDAAGAMREVEAALKEDADLPVARAVRASLRLGAGDAAGAVADCDAAMQAGFRPAEVFFTRALAHERLGNPGQAEADCTAAIETDPAHANAWNSRGIIRMQQDRFDEALADYAEAMRLQPDWELPYVNRSNIRVRRGEYDAAIADLTKYLELSRLPGKPPNPRAMAMVYWNRGLCHQERGDTARAEADFREAAARDPELAARRRSS